MTDNEMNEVMEQVGTPDPETNMQSDYADLQSRYEAQSKQLAETQVTVRRMEAMARLQDDGYPVSLVDLVDLSSDEKASASLDHLMETFTNAANESRRKQLEKRAKEDPESTHSINPFRVVMGLERGRK